MSIVTHRSLAAGSACVEAGQHIWILLTDVNRLLDTAECILRFVISDMTAVALVVWVRLIVCATMSRTGFAISRLVRMLGYRWIVVWLDVCGCFVGLV